MAEAFTKLYPLILDHSPLPDSLSEKPIELAAALPDPSLLIFDLAVAPIGTQSAIDIEKSRGLRASTRLQWIPFSAPSIAWIYFNGSALGESYRKTLEAEDAGRDLNEAYLEVHLMSTSAQTLRLMSISPYIVRLRQHRCCKGARPRASVHVRDDAHWRLSSVCKSE